MVRADRGTENVATVQRFLRRNDENCFPLKTVSCIWSFDCKSVKSYYISEIRFVSFAERSRVSETPL